MKATFKGGVCSIHIQTTQEVMAQFQGEVGETFMVNRKGKLITASRQGVMGDLVQTILFQKAVNNKEVEVFYKTHNGDFVVGKHRTVNGDSLRSVNSFVFSSFFMKWQRGLIYLAWHHIDPLSFIKEAPNNTDKRTATMLDVPP